MSCIRMSTASRRKLVCGRAVTPDRKLGRVTATLGIGVFLLGLILGGALAEIVGLRPTLLAAGFCGVLGAGWLFLSAGVEDERISPRRR